MNTVSKYTQKDFVFLTISMTCQNSLIFLYVKVYLILYTNIFEKNSCDLSKRFAFLLLLPTELFENLKIPGKNKIRSNSEVYLYCSGITENVQKANKHLANTDRRTKRNRQTANAKTCIEKKRNYMIAYTIRLALHTATFIIPQAFFPVFHWLMTSTAFPIYTVNG